MLVFVDESYQEESNPQAKSTFAAVLVQEGKYRDFDNRLFELKKHFWKVANPYDLELKGRKLMSERALVMPKTRDFISQIISLCKEVNAVVFAVVQDGSFTLASESDHLPSLYRALMRRVNTFMEVKFPDEQAVFFFDGIDHETNRTVAISFNNFMFRHWWGRSYKNIIPTSFFCDSLVSPGIQMADVLAYCVNQRYGGRRGYLEELFQEFRNITYNHEVPDEAFTLWGVQRIPAEEKLPFTADVSMVIKETEVIVKESVEIVEKKEGETGDPSGSATPHVK
jgi:hypothetical protein